MIWTKGILCFLLFIHGRILYVNAIRPRCRAPSAIPHATASEPLTPYITFPHGTTVTYTCDVGKMATGSNTVFCENGKWTASNFACLDERRCLIPSGAQYRRSVYRQQAGSSTINYPAGYLIGRGSTIVAICKKDIFGDVITKWNLSKCDSGQWIPSLPSCKVHSRCRAPPSIEHAKASERITPYITFPHGTIVTYICDVSKMATGSDTTICTDGQWSKTSFHCEDNPDNMPGNTTVISFAFESRTCSQLTVVNGKIDLKDAADNTYDVTCNARFRLKSTQTNTYICRGGTWIGIQPECVRAPQQCKVSNVTRRLSEITSKATGESINAIHIDHWTQIVQTCRLKLRNTKSGTARCINGRWRPALFSCPLIDGGNRRRNSDDQTTWEMTTNEDLSTLNMMSVNTATSTETIISTSTEDKETIHVASSDQTTTVTIPQTTISTSIEDKETIYVASSDQTTTVTIPQTTSVEDKATSGMTSSMKATTVTTISISVEDKAISGMTSSTNETTFQTPQMSISTSSEDKATFGMTSSTNETTFTTPKMSISTSSEDKATFGMTSSTKANTFYDLVMFFFYSKTGPNR